MDGSGLSLYEKVLLGPGSGRIQESLRTPKAFGVAAEVTRPNGLMAKLSPVTSKPASRGRIKTGRS